ncbi:phage late control D family protein, partial [Candidatus Gracilibacteria bacterium]|nr:phage late control D family protein [Candidatus Gracilibacteria bacterium]
MFLIISEFSKKSKRIKINHQDKNTEGDANSPTRLPKAYGAVGKIKRGHFFFVERGGGKTASGEKLPTATIYRSE